MKVFNHQSNSYQYFFRLQDLYCVRSDLGNLLKALGRLDEAKVGQARCDMNAEPVDTLCHVWFFYAAVRGKHGSW